MSRPTHRRRLALGVAAVATLGLTLSGAAIAAPDDAPSEAQQRALDAGFQVAPKSGSPALRGSQQPNPYLANGNEVTKADYAAWRTRMARAGEQRAASPSYRAARARAQAQMRSSATELRYQEQEPAGESGANDTVETAEPIAGFGSRPKQSNVLRIDGEQAAVGVPEPTELPTVAEDNGSIPLAGETGIDGSSAVETTGVLGDGPHGSEGTGTNDFDFYAVDLEAGLSMVAETTLEADDGSDTILALYTAEGEPIAADDDGGEGFASRLEFTAEESGTYYLLVAGFSEAGPLPADPTDSGSGAGGAAEGPYGLAIAQQESTEDRDFYSVALRPGDVIGGTLSGGSDLLRIIRPDGTEAVGSQALDASSLYPPSAPLPGGGNTTVAYVVEEKGRYVVEVGGGTGEYRAQLEAYRPGAQGDTKPKQTVVLDFRGGRVNTGIWGGPGVRELSPFKSFLEDWDIPASRRDAMIEAITDEVRDNLRAEVSRGGLQGPVQLRVVDQRGNKKLIGTENVSRVVVGGSIEESGIPTIGIAQFIDPGNYAHEDTALVLLDVLSGDDPSDPASLNTYLTEESDTEAFVSQAVGNVIAHEVGHMIGSYHTDNESDVVNLMDAGGTGFDGLFGVGPDGIGGTADDLDVHFEEDSYIPAEGFTGLEDTMNVASWAYPSRD